MGKAQFSAFGTYLTTLRELLSGAAEVEGNLTTTCEHGGEYCTQFSAPGTEGEVSWVLCHEVRDDKVKIWLIRPPITVTK
uniref:Transthyretin-like family protein n=1 Tax=Ascaris lumbricoides TaxID=6252 RepID=A0A0M3I488_ASCLU